MDFVSQIVPAVILLAANLMGGRHGSNRWEAVTAIFGWTALIGILAVVLVSIFLHDSWVRDYLVQIAGFSLLTALSRDYEKILRPLFWWNR
jgi:hypothetical protein